MRGGDGGKNSSDGIELENAFIRGRMFEDSWMIKCTIRKETKLQANDLTSSLPLKELSFIATVKSGISTER